MSEHRVKESHTIPIRLVAPLSEFSQRFVQAMADRMAVSFHKYGYQAEADIDHLACLKQRVDVYLQTGNPEFLADVANFAMMLAEKHWDAWRSTDSDESPGRVRVDGAVDAEPNNGAR